MASLPYDHSDVEYGTIMRIDNDRIPPYTHQLLLSDREPSHIIQFCHKMTLAQGRILYELWDYSQYEPWNARRRGYFVPAHIVIEARKLSCQTRADDWKHLHPATVNRRERAWAAVVRTWPRIPTFAAKKVVDRVVAMGVEWSKYEVDEAVVRYAMSEWTNYAMRVEGRGGRNCAADLCYGVEEVDQQAKQAVSSRLRDVLEKWTNLEASLSSIEDLFEQHGLREVAVARPSYGGGRLFL